MDTNTILSNSVITGLWFQNNKTTILFYNGIKHDSLRQIEILEWNLMMMTLLDKRALAQNAQVDEGLVAMFLRMNPEERISANDNSLRTIRELRDAFSQQKKHTSDHRSERIA